MGPLEDSARQEIITQVMEAGSCQHIESVPADLRRTFVVSGDISAEEHVRMQAAMQAFVDNSLSKTINFPADATTDDVARAYQLAWELGCKGITVYVTGSRQKVVLETKETARQKQKIQTEVDKPSGSKGQLAIWNETKKARPRCLPGSTYQINTPLGKAFVTITRTASSSRLRCS